MSTEQAEGARLLAPGFARAPGVPASRATSLLDLLLDRGPVLCLAGSIAGQLVPWQAAGLPQTAFSDLLIMVAFGWGLLRAVVTRRTWVLSTWALVVAMVGIALATVSAMSSPEPRTSMIGLVRMVEIFVFFPGACLLAIRRRRDLVLVLGALLALYAGQCLFGLWQFLTGHGALIGGKPIRAVGTFGATNIGVLATMASSGLGFATAYTLSHHGRKRVLGLVLMAVMAGGLGAGLGRSSWITAFIICLVLLTRFDLRRAVAVVAGGAVFAWVTVAWAATSTSAIGRRIMSVVEAGADPDQSGIDRLSLWEASRAILNDYPLLGVGARQFQAHRDAYSPLALLGSSDIGTAGSFARQALLSPHNLYYLLSTEFGIPTAVCFFTIPAGALIIGASRLRRTPVSNETASFVGLAAAGALGTFFIGGMFGDLGGPASLILGWSLGLSAWWASHRELLDDSQAVGEDGGPIWWSRPGPSARPRPLPDDLRGATMEGRTRDRH